MTNKSHAMHLMILEVTEKHGITEMYNDMDTETRKHFFQFVESVSRSNTIKGIGISEIMLVAYIIGYDRGWRSPTSSHLGT